MKSDDKVRVVKVIALSTVLAIGMLLNSFALAAVPLVLLAMIVFGIREA